VYSANRRAQRQFQPVFNRRCSLAGALMPGGLARPDKLPGCSDHWIIFINPRRSRRAAKIRPTLTKLCITVRAQVSP